jgi:aspartate ammonia-lyase
MIKQTVYYVEGNDLTISRAVSEGEMDYNVNLPIIISSLFDSIVYIRRAIRTLREKAIEGLVVIDNEYDVTDNATVITGILPIIGYEKAQEISQIASDTNKPIIKILDEMNIMTISEIKSAFTKDGITTLSLISKTKKED